LLLRFSIDATFPRGKDHDVHACKMQATVLPILHDRWFDWNPHSDEIHTYGSTTLYQCKLSDATPFPKTIQPRSVMGTFLRKH